MHFVRCSISHEDVQAMDEVQEEGEIHFHNKNYLFRSIIIEHGNEGSSDSMWQVLWEGEVDVSDTATMSLNEVAAEEGWESMKEVLVIALDLRRYLWLQAVGMSEKKKRRNVIGEQTSWFSVRRCEILSCSAC